VPQRDFEHFVAPVADTVKRRRDFEISDDPDALRTRSSVVERHTLLAFPVAIRGRLPI